jgi:hypothetical protein
MKRMVLTSGRVEADIAAQHRPGEKGLRAFLPAMRYDARVSDT